MKKGNKIKILKIACTYTGTVIGAGFASGQEIMQFFVIYGSNGLIGVIVAALLFGLLGSYILNLSHRLNAMTYHHIIYHTCGKYAGGLLDYATGLFLFAGLSIMLAGMSSVISTYCSINSCWALLLSGLITGVIVMMGLSGIETANAIIIPILLLSTLIIGSYSFYYHHFSLSFLTVAPSQLPLIPHFFLASFLYVAYNMLLGTTILAPMGAHTQNRRIRMLGGILGGTMLGMMMILIAIILLIHCPLIQNYEIPMLYIASIQSSWSYALYAVILFGAMLTTAISTLYGCITKLSSLFHLSYHWELITLLIVAMTLSTIGFAKLISVIYPFFGIISSYFTLMLIFQVFRGMLRRLTLR